MIILGSQRTGVKYLTVGHTSHAVPRKLFYTVPVLTITASEIGTSGTLTMAKLCESVKVQ